MLTINEEIECWVSTRYRCSDQRPCLNWASAAKPLCGRTIDSAGSQPSMHAVAPAVRPIARLQ